MATMPKRVKYRKQQRGVLKGNATRGNYVAFGDFGLQALEMHWISARQIEAGRVAATHFLHRQGKIYIRIFPDKPISKKPLETRMGKTPVALQGFLEQVAKEAGVEIPESNEQPPQPAGKQFTARSVDLRLKQVTLESLAKFLRGIETGPNLVVVTGLNIRTRDDKHQDLEVEMTVTTWDRVSEKPGKSGKKGDKT